MDRMLYIAMTGAKQTLLAQAANTNNLANASTTAFRADFEAFRAMPVYGDGYPSRVYAMAERPGVDLKSGTVVSTGRELDVAVSGEGWIAVQAADGSEAYTRAGDLRFSSNGLLTTGTGLAVLGNGGPIAVPPAEKIEIGVDGTISARGLGQAPNTLSAVDRIRLVNPPKGDLVKGKDGLLRLRNGEPAAVDENVRLVSGSLESSNVNAVEAMVSLITLSRQFEMQVKAMRASEDIDQSAAQILRM
ncbi:MAG: flagellar basal body rod protein FlgF [Gammaproteobacteria bacterium]|nr:flagellar basal body rod protein FlgF [Gammaproteobacteria bacterium]